jgi:hypothetical protein
MALAYYEALTPRQAQRNEQAFGESRVAALVASAGSLAGPALECCTWAPSLPDSRKLFLMSKDSGPRAALYLAVRAVRRALARDQTDNPQAFLLLGEVYDGLSNSRELAWNVKNPLLNWLRAVQSIYAYNQALALDPDIEQAHVRLEALYRAMRYKDLTVKHMKELLRILRAKGPQTKLFADGLRRETAKEFSERLRGLESVIEDREKDIEEQRKAFDLRAQDFKVVDRARLVKESGLAAKALEILLKSDYAAFGIEGMDLELRLLLTTGQMDRVRAWMEDEQEEVLGSHTYRRNLAHMGAATGDYQAADENFAASVPNYAGMTPEPIPARPAAALILGHALLDLEDNPITKIMLGVSRAALRAKVSFPDRASSTFYLYGLAKVLNDEADINALRGLLAVEAGRMTEAQLRFQEARVFWRSPTYTALGDGGSWTGPEITEEMLELLRKNRRPTD